MKIYNWDNRLVIYEPEPINLASCCGSSFYYKRSALSNQHGGCGNGIGIYLTDVIKNAEDDKVKIETIQTRQGPITFALRKVI